MPRPFYDEGFYLDEACQLLNILRIALPIQTTNMHFAIQRRRISPFVWQLLFGLARFFEWHFEFQPPSLL
jgi:hypothetical protein